MQKFKEGMKVFKITLKGLGLGYKRQFASPFDLDKIVNAKHQLKVQILKELKHSEDFDLKNQFFDNFLNGNGFKLIEVPESSEVILLKKDDMTSYTIEIVFEAREKPIDPGLKPEKNKKKKDEAAEEFAEPTDEEELQNDAPDPMEKKDEIEMQQEDLYKQHDGKQEFEKCDFTVFISSHKMKEVLVFDCDTSDSVINIKRTTVIQDIEKFKSLKKEIRATFFYQGPEFQHLDNILQQSLRDYLSGFGVNSELGRFIDGYSLKRDLDLYENWLKKLDKFLER